VKKREAHVGAEAGAEVGTGSLTPVLGNPGFAGETGEFSTLTEADVRGTAVTVGRRPLGGSHAAGACASYPYQLLQQGSGSAAVRGALP
jgi:hypothetical protein